VTTVRHNREFWEAAVREIERGGRVSEVAGRLGVKAGTLSWWAWRLRSESRKQKRPRASRAEFLPVVVKASLAPERARLVEVDAGSVRVRAEVGADVNYVAALVRALRSAC
jgi:transposase-like protein